jgi:flagellar protein FlbD
MIRLTRLNKQPIGVNSDLVKFVENSPDTLITLITGEKILVRESYEEIVSLIVAFRQRVLAGVDPSAYASGGPGIEALRRAGMSSPGVRSLPENNALEMPSETDQNEERG